MYGKTIPEMKIKGFTVCPVKDARTLNANSTAYSTRVYTKLQVRCISAFDQDRVFENINKYPARAIFVDVFKHAVLIEGRYATHL